MEKEIHAINKAVSVMKKRSLAFVFILISVIVVARPIDPYGLQTDIQRQRFATLTQSLRCLVCQNETIAESQAPLAQDLRQRVADKILKNESNGVIIEDLKQRYGDFVHYQPPFTLSTLLLWSGPFILLIVGIYCLLKSIKKRRGLNQ